MSATVKYLHDEDLELQIELARLQTDVWISVAACVTYLGLIGVFMIALFQSFLAAPESQLVMRFSFLAAYGVLAVLFFLVGRLAVREIGQKRKEIVDLKKRYIW